ncbi:MAG TPA: ATP-binding protein [Rectinema sp.]|nr:ATP-binding protein [Rectinema sp.]HNY99048.1 ATP-binding protein [Rectinema sp.]HOD58766.1 ATP-binding protein [Rectinema sp.]HOE76541.1 ATP-binding protein [Rectinema sp.]HOH05446.1 ATP-binding protein [Rectinema sp.]
MIIEYNIPRLDFFAAGKTSTDLKHRLIQLGLPPPLIKRIAIAAYEAEMNIAIHGDGGRAEIDISKDKITTRFIDHGPGIPDIELAMQEGYSTAPEEIQNMGFGAGMGLPNMKKNADELIIQSEPNNGTTVVMHFNLFSGES